MLSVSIIIPVYKVEKYIIGCVESVLRQTYRHLEVILVDDCSPDRSMPIAKEYILNSAKSRDLKFLYLRHDRNQGLSAARNTGINSATGDYIFFLDSDDQLTEDCIQILVENSDGGRIDVVCGGFKVIGNENSLWHKYYFTDDYISGNRNVIRYYVSGRLNIMAWNKLIRRKIITESNLSFLEGVIHEDNHWSFMLANHINTLKMISHKGYLYYHRDDSITGTPDYRRRYDSYVKIIEAFDAAEKSGLIVDYPECYKFIDRQKLQWINELWNVEAFSFNEKRAYFMRILKLRRSVSFLFNFSILPLKWFCWRIIDIFVIIRSKLKRMGTLTFAY